MVMPRNKHTINLIGRILFFPFMRQERAGVSPQLAISWVLTWFAHDLEHWYVMFSSMLSLSLVLSTYRLFIATRESVTRIYDACLASHPLFVVYIATALIEVSIQYILRLVNWLLRCHQLSISSHD